MAEKQVGKTTLVKKILTKRKTNVCGFFTLRFPDLVDSQGQCPIYIYGINEEPTIDDNHLVGTCGNGKHYSNEDVFNNLGIKYITTKNSKDLIVMDELGFLEMNAEEFKNKVFDVLTSDNPVLITLKQRLDIDFLKKIKENNNIEFINMNIENRDDVFNYISKQFSI